MLPQLKRLMEINEQLTKPSIYYTITIDHPSITKEELKTNLYTTKYYQNLDIKKFKLYFKKEIENLPRLFREEIASNEFTFTGPYLVKDQEIVQKDEVNDSHEFNNLVKTEVIKIRNNPSYSSDFLQTYYTPDEIDELVNN